MKSTPIIRTTTEILLAVSLLAAGAAALGQSVTFTANQPPIPVGFEPTCVIAADLTGDGFVDLITADFGTNTLTILTNTGKGTFVFGTNVTVGNGPYCVLAADFNGDGKLDLACVNEFDGTLTILTNGGRLSFVQATNIALGSNAYPLWLATADFNGDGLPDLVCANSGANTLTVLTNAGNAVFISSSTNTVGGMPYFVLAADLNNGGGFDLISANNDVGSVTILTNNGNGVFTLASTASVGGSSSPTSIAAANLNRGGPLDLLVADSGGDTLTVLTNRGSGHFGTFTNLVVGGSGESNPQFVAAADLTGNSFVYLISACPGSGNLAIWTNTVNGSFVSVTNIAIPNIPFCVTVADVIGNGSPDLITVNEDGTVTVFAVSSYLGAPVLVHPGYSAQTGFQASLLAAVGSTNVIQVSSNMITWTPLVTNVNTNVAWPFTNAVPGLPRRFYRAVTP